MFISSIKINASFDICKQVNATILKEMKSEHDHILIDLQDVIVNYIFYNVLICHSNHKPENKYLFLLNRPIDNH